MDDVDKNKFGAGFKLSSVFSKAFKVKYLKAWLLALVYAIVVQIVAGILNALLAVTVVLPFIVMGFAMIIIAITTMTLLGEAYPEL